MRDYTITATDGHGYTATVVTASSGAQARRKAERALAGLFIVSVHRTPGAPA